MPRLPGPWIPTVVLATPPAAPPTNAQLLPDRACDEWEIRYSATGAAVTLTASGGSPARLWGYNGSRWVELESVFQASARTIADGQDAQDFVARAGPGIAALFVQYSGGITNPGNLTAATRTIRQT